MNKEFYTFYILYFILIRDKAFSRFIYNNYYINCLVINLGQHKVYLEAKK